MPTKRLTQPTVDKIAAPTDRPQIDVYDSVLAGFGVRVGRKRRSYFVMVRALKRGEWKLTRVTLGTTLELDLATARKQAQEAIARAAKGLPPEDVRKERKDAQESESRNTFASVRAEFLPSYRTRRNKDKKPSKPAPRTLAEIARALSSDPFSQWDDRPIASITSADVRAALRVIVKRGHETAANRYLSYLQILMKWAKEQEYIATDPSEGIQKPGAESSGTRVLDPKELRAIWQAASDRPESLFSDIIKVLILTGQRRTEVAGMRWSEITDSYLLPRDEEGRDKGPEVCSAWTIPEARSKNGRKHIVPLSNAVLAILEKRKAEQTILGAKANTPGTDKPTDLVFTSNFVSAFSGWSRAKRNLDAQVAARTDDDIEHWSLHDIRRSVATAMNEALHVRPHIVEAVLNHVSGFRAGVAGTYNHAEYVRERRAALDAWAGYVLQIVGEAEAPDNVVSMFSTKRNT